MVNVKVESQDRKSAVRDVDGGLGSAVSEEGPDQKIGIIASPGALSHSHSSVDDRGSGSVVDQIGGSTKSVTYNCQQVLDYDIDIVEGFLIASFDTLGDLQVRNGSFVWRACSALRRMMRAPVGNSDGVIASSLGLRL